MKKLITLNEAWGFPTSDGLLWWLTNISDLTSSYEVPWAIDELLDIESLDLDFHYNNSGDRIISPLLEKMLGSSSILDSTAKRKISHIIYNRFIERWKRLYKIYAVEYNPIENYDRTEVTKVESDIDRTNTGTSDLDRTGTVETDNTGTVETETDDTTTNYVNSYNSGLVQDTESVLDGDTTVTNNLNIKDTYNTNDKTTLNLADTEDSIVDTTSNIHGNIGVTTSQQMLQSENDFWKMYDFWKQVYKDIDSICCLRVY